MLSLINWIYITWCIDGRIFPQRPCLAYRWTLATTYSHPNHVDAWDKGSLTFTDFTGKISWHFHLIILIFHLIDLASECFRYIVVKMNWSWKVSGVSRFNYWYCDNCPARTETKPFHARFNKWLLQEFAFRLVLDVRFMLHEWPASIEVTTASFFPIRTTSTSTTSRTAAFQKKLAVI